MTLTYPNPHDELAAIAILQARAEAEAVPLPDALATYMAGRMIQSTARELEGALIRVIAYASLTDQELSIELAREVLDAYMPCQGRVN